MKNLKLFRASLVLIALALLTLQNSYSQTQSPDDFFIGEWNATITGLPDGDMSFIINIINHEDTLQAQIYDEARAFIMPIEKVTRKAENTLSLSFYDSNNGVDVIINLIKKDEDNITGDVANMYTLYGTRRN